MLINKKAVSTLILIILLLCSTVFGALISYLWVMANYYMEPENTVDLVITEVDFPVNHADYFYVTVMNPTHSSSGTNITEIYFTAEGNDTKYSVLDTLPEELPITLERGTTKTIKCNKNWGAFAGKTITVHVSATNASGATYSFKTEFVKLNVQAYFNATESIKYFNVTVKNDAQSKINLTLNEVDFKVVEYQPITNISIELPMVVPINDTVEFKCYYDWQGYPKPAVRVKTLEGYIFDIEKEVSSTVILVVTNVTFNETNTTKLNVTLWNSPDSGTLVDVSNITLTDDEGNETEIEIFDTPVRIDKNETVTLDCVWNWTEYRDRNITINAYTKQGFKAVSKTVKTPAPVVLKITALDFNLTDTGSFSVSVQNMNCSIQEANITKFVIFYNNTFTEINGTDVTPNLPSLLGIRNQTTFVCTFNWKAYEGLNVNITVYTEKGFNATYSYTLPKVLITVNFDSSKSTNYFSITIQNNAYLTINVTEIYVNDTWINASLTYPILPVSVEDGQNILIVCPFDWQSLSGNEVAIVVKTENGFDITTTIIIP
ncbi:MAG: hypothetical protein ACUVTB_00795 [Candidatus Bathycorpusculaceae bacterium]